MPTGHLRTNKRRPKDAERMRIAIEMQRPGENLRCGFPDAQERREDICPGAPDINRSDKRRVTNPARTTHEIEGFPI
jgi:hypothetical protein